MDYAAKLYQFNSTEKYLSELKFLKLHLENCVTILDYGCGNGMAADWLSNHGNFNVHGFDVIHYNEMFHYTTHPINYDVTYFMHSLAHIKDVKEVLSKLNTKKVVVITPNKGWLKLNEADTYKKDDTVIEHFSQQTLIELFLETGYKIEQSGQFGQCSGNQNERLFLIATK
jgi:2-polyprenyl-3-methyl-5-hydroxy-6-metoxy-1,4-benzoquinol methylase